MAQKKNPSNPNMSRTYDLLASSPDTLPISYRRLVGFKATKLGSYDKHLANCKGLYRISTCAYTQ